MGGIGLFFISFGVLNAEGCGKRCCEKWVEEGQKLKLGYHLA